MKAFSIILVIAAFLAFGSPVWAQQGQVTKVFPEKFNKLTPAQKEKFKEMGREAQSAAEESIKDYNEVEKEATDAKNTAEAVRDTATEVEKGLTGTAVGQKP